MPLSVASPLLRGRTQLPLLASQVLVSLLSADRTLSLGDFLCHIDSQEIVDIALSVQRALMFGLALIAILPLL